MNPIKQAIHFPGAKINEFSATMAKDLKDLKPGERVSRGYAAYGAHQNLKPYVFVLPPLKDDEVEIKTICCGCCHTDLSMIKNDLGLSQYPFVPGHEAIGIITEMGPSARLANPDLKIGQRVGVGFFKRSCHTCEFCCKGEENICPNGEPVLAKNASNGGWSEYLHVDAAWAIPIPDELPSELAAPLMCAGITVYAPLMHYKIRAGMKVGVIGLGGLGHLFVKMAKVLGCEIYVFSHTEEKETDSKMLGAAHFVRHDNKSEMMPLEEQLDFILNTTYANLDWEKFMNVLKPDGNFCFVGFPPSEIKVAPFSLIYKQRRVVGSNVGSPTWLKEMLEFCVRNNITAESEVFSINECNKVIKNFEPDGYRYRAVFRIENEYDRDFNVE